MRASTMTLAVAVCVLMVVSAPAALGQDEALEEPLPEGEVAPDFQIATLEGSPVKLSDWSGQVVVLNFFITWYRDAAGHLKVMEDLGARYADQRLKLLSISLDQGETGPAVTKQFVTDQEIAHAVAADPGQEVSGKYGVRALPATFVIGRDGKIARYQEGYIEGDEVHLEQMITDTLAAGAAEAAAGAEAAAEETPEPAEEEPVYHCFKQ